MDRHAPAIVTPVRRNQGEACLAPTLSPRQLLDLYPAALFRGFVALLGELDSLGTLQQPPAEGLVEDDVPEEELPLDLEGVLVLALIRELLPVRRVAVRIVHVGVPDGTRRGRVRLHPAFAQPTSDWAELRGSRRIRL